MLTPLKTTVKLPIAIFILFACDQDESPIEQIEISTDSQITVSFHEDGQPMTNTSFRLNVDNYFDNGNLFEGQTDENGSIEVGSLNIGTYYFRLNPDSNGYMHGSLQVQAKDTLYDFNLRDCQSSVFYETNAPSYFSTELLLIPNEVVTMELSDDDKISASVAGTLGNSAITFQNVLDGDYTLAVLDERIGVYPLHDVQVNRDYDIHGNFDLDVYSVLNATRWNTISTQLLDNGTDAENLVQTISFSVENMTITFSDGVFHSQPYVAGFAGNGGLDIFLYANSGEIRPELDAFLYITVNAEGVMGIEYFDQGGLTYQSFLDLEE